MERSSYLSTIDVAREERNVRGDKFVDGGGR